MTAYYREERVSPGSIRSIYDCSVQSRVGPATVANPHIHEYFEVLYCQSGAFALTLNEKPFALHPGDMALIDPMEVHCTRAMGPELNQYLVIKFVPEVLYSAEAMIYELKYVLPYLRGSGSHQKVFSAEQTKAAAVGEILQQIVDEFMKKDFGYEIALRANISRLFLWILRCWHVSGSSTLPDDAVLAALSRAYAYVDAHSSQDISLKDAAEACGMGYLPFSRFFTRYAGLGFSEYLTQVRLRKAAFLLAQTNDSVTDVAMASGFSTTSYFIQRFKAFQGMTPKRFRDWIQPSPQPLGDNANFRPKQD